MAAWVSQVIHDVDFEKLLLLQTENSSIDCCSLFFSDGTNWSQSLGSLQQVVDEFLKIDKCKICWTVNCEDKCFVHSRLWFLWKTWNHWGCPGKKIQSKYLEYWYKSASSCSTYTNKLLSLDFIFNVQYFIKINVNIVRQLSLQQKIFVKTKQNYFS